MWASFRYLVPLNIQREVYTIDVYVNVCVVIEIPWFNRTLSSLSLSFSEDGAVSEPAVSLSTFILAHLPFSTMEEEKLQWPYEDASSQ